VGKTWANIKLEENKSKKFGIIKLKNKPKITKRTKILIVKEKIIYFIFSLKKFLNLCKYQKVLPAITLIRPLIWGQDF
jgi:hypothetical protein